MFWTKEQTQYNLFGEGEPIGSDCIAKLIRKAREIFGGDCEQELHRRFALLTHVSTQAFLKPMLVAKYGSVDEAKTPTLEWLDDLGSLETFARSTRDSDCSNGQAAGGEKRALPAWYTRYLQTDRWRHVKSEAESLWASAIMRDGLRCNINSRHGVEEWHHADYARCGEGDEFRCLVPLCARCHNQIRIVGPAVPQNIPEGVKQWL